MTPAPQMDFRIRGALTHTFRTLALAGLVFLMSSAIPSHAEGETPRVGAFVSILPEAFFVEEVGGPLVQVDVLVGPGQSPHTFEPTPKQMARLAGAQVYFTIGLPFEKKLVEKIAAANSNLNILDAAKGIKRSHHNETDEDAEPTGSPSETEGPTHKHEESEEDPHLWLSPRSAKLIAANICEGLKSVDPAHGVDYEKNLRALKARLDELDGKLARALAPLKGKEFMVFHPAFGHFAKEYGLKQVAVEVEGKEPSAKQLTQLIDWAKKQGVRVIFVQPQFSRKSAEAIAKAIGGVVVPMDPLAKDYVRNLEEMAAKIENALRQP